MLAGSQRYRKICVGLAQLHCLFLFNITKLIHQVQMWVQRSQVPCAFDTRFCPNARLPQNDTRLQTPRSAEARCEQGKWGCTQGTELEGRALCTHGVGWNHMAAGRGD